MALFGHLDEGPQTQGTIQMEMEIGFRQRGNYLAW